MKLKVTHSARPCAASIRRASAVRTWRGVSVGGGTGAARGSETGGTASRPRRRSTSSIRSHSGSITAQPSAAARGARRVEVRRLLQRRSGAATSLRQDGTATVTCVGVARAARAKPRRSSDATASSGGTSAPPSAGQAGEAQRGVALPGRRRAGRDDRAGLAAAEVEDHRASRPRSRRASARGRCRARSAGARRRRSGGGGRSARRAPDRTARIRRTRAVVASSQPVASPPITPASDCTPAASAMTQSSGVDACSPCRSARGTSRRRRGAASACRRCSLPTSNTCSGRPRSMVKKLVTSTSALIGRRPIAVSRSCSQCGLGAVAQAADGAAEHPGAGLRPVDRASAGRRRTRARRGAGATASACRSRRRRGRARCRAPTKQSPRLGVTLISITGSSSPAQAA